MEINLGRVRGSAVRAVQAAVRVYNHLQNMYGAARQSKIDEKSEDEQAFQRPVLYDKNGIPVFVSTESQKIDRQYGIGPGGNCIERSLNPMPTGGHLDRRA